MSDTPRPRRVQLADFWLSIGLAICLALSAIAFGRLTLKFGSDVYSEILNSGLENAVDNLGQKMATLAVNDMIGQFSTSALSFDIGLFSSLATAVLAPVLFVGVWLRLAKMAISRFMRGVWALVPRDDIEEDALGPLPTIGAVNELLMAEDFQTARLSQEDRAILGRHGRYTPRAFITLQRSLRLPAKQALRPLLRGLFWGAMALAVLVGLILLLSGQSELLVPAATQVGGNFARAFGMPSVLMALALLGAGIIGMLMDLRFARALAPRQKPQANKTMEMLRDLTSNATPDQFLSVLKSEFAIRLKQVRISTSGIDGSREGFVDQSNFFLEVLIEGLSKPTENTGSSGALRRLWIGVALSLLGAAVPLFLLFPSSLQSMLQFERFNLTGTSSALIWMLIALAAGRAMRNLGTRAMTDAEVVLQSDWHETPVAAIRIDGTVNTQTALTGRARDDSYGAENRIQQSRYDARLMTCTLTTVAPKIEAPREIIAFNSHGPATQLHHSVAELLRQEGSKSTFSAVNTTIEDNQAILTMAELRKAELKLRLAKTEDELKRLEKSEGEFGEDS